MRVQVIDDDSDDEKSNKSMKADEVRNEPPTDSELGKAIEHAFGSFDGLIYNVMKTRIGASGSSWVWLAYNKLTDDIDLVVSHNNRSLINKFDKFIPLLTIDIPVNSYYHDYQDETPDTIH